MGKLFRVIVFFGAIIASYIASLQFRSTNPADLMTGGAILLFAAFLLFYFTRKIWRFIGCFPALLLIIIAIFALVFSVSGKQMLQNLMGSAKEAAVQTVSAVNGQMAQSAPTQQGAPADAQAQQPQQMPVQPQQPPIIEGHIQQINGGDSFILNGLSIRLYALAAPVITQKCKDHHGFEYNCGYLAARKLKEFVGQDSISCRIMSRNPKGDLMAACNIGGIDVGAAMVEEGWAVALPEIAPVYIPYEQKAQQKRAGMWSGSFKMPWEWEAEQMQIQKSLNNVEVPNIKVKRKRKQSGGSVFDFF